MNTKTKWMRVAVLMGAATVALAACCSCKPMCVTKENTAAGFNGSFELLHDGLPVNWQLYTAETAGEGDFDVSIDSADAQDGKRSLKLEVRACAKSGGWKSPGLSKQLDAKPEETYSIRFWIKNNGATCVARIGGVSAHEGSYETVYEANSVTDGWQKVEYVYKVPAGMQALRFELNALSPGTLWIDAVQLQNVQ